MEVSSKEKSNLIKAAGMLAIIVSIFFLVKIVAEVKSLRFIGGGVPAGNTMSFDGKGEVTAAPDIATLSLTIREEAKTAKEAQAKATAKEKIILEILKKQGIAEKDIKTESYNLYPKYEQGKPCYGDSGYGHGCPAYIESPQVAGYEVSEYLSVKVRELEKAGDILGNVVREAGGVEISGPNFTIEKEEEFKAEARGKAIEEAKAKAEALAKDLGIKLVRIVNFSENGNYPGPYMYAAKNMAMDSVGESAPAPELPTGENKIISSVTITYEIR